MDKIYVVQISDAYPESYWFKCEILTGQDAIELKKGVKVDGVWNVELRLDTRSSLDRVLGFDFLFSDGPNFISPKLYDILVEAEVSGLQFIDADVYIQGKAYKGYKILNFTHSLAAFDEEKSKSEPLLSYVPDGPRKYTDIVLREICSTDIDMFRAVEDFTVMLAVERVKVLFESHQVIGAQFKERVLQNEF